MRAAALVLLMAATLARAEDDPYLWLEDVAGEKAMAWVREQNRVSQPLLESQPGFKALHERLLAIHNSRERIPQVVKRGPWLYNFWQDARNPRGLWRRASLEEYRKAEPAWETVLDVDALSAAEGEKWVFKGATCLHPDHDRCLVSISRAGADAVEVREYDIPARQWVKDGFAAKESKGSVAWRDRDTIYVARDFGPGTMTTSGYPRIVKEWKRGTKLAEARTVFEGEKDDVGASPEVVNEGARRYEWLRRDITFWEGEYRVRRGGGWVPLAIPRDATAAPFNGMLLVRLRSDWKPADRLFKAGSLLSADLDRFLDGHRELAVVFEPKPRVALQRYEATRGALVLDVLDNVQGRVIEARPGGGGWKLREVAVPPAAALDIAAFDRDASDDYWITVTGFTEPTTLYLARSGRDAREKMKALPAFFDAKGLAVAQHEAVSRDGTRVPYFVVRRAGAPLDGKDPTILYGYGGFEVSMTPSYSGTIGAAWLEGGGTWVLANLRGGGEFGPAWHETALREGRQKTHDDFIAVAQDLVRRGITSPRHLGIMGGSQGGLLVGAAFTQRPELFRAVACAVPLLDMKRYHKLLAGASWMAEYGDPDDPRDWEFIAKYSPYHNVVKGRRYPKVFFTTSTRDDRVHPGHARKMVARMKEQGHEVLYFEYTEGGHSAGSLPAQQAYTWALVYTMFRRELR